jgi:cytochrome c5
MFRFTGLAALGGIVGISIFALVAIPAVAQAQQSKPQAAPAAVSAAGITLHSVSIALPPGDRMFPGKDADAINSNCLACHSAGMVLQQPALSRAAWQAEVEKMRSQYKAPVAETDVPAIVAYLEAHKGTR